MIRLGFVTAITFCFWALVTGCVLVNESGQNGVSLTFIASNPRPTFHEPVFLDIVIQNDLGESILFDLGHNRKSNLEFEITQPDGTIVRVPRLSEEGFGRVGKLTLRSGESYRQRIVLNEWYQFPQPGTYNVEGALVTSIKTESGLVVKPKRSGTIKLDVLPADPVMLASVCQKLAAIAQDPFNATAANDASFALSYVRDPIATPYLKEILAKGNATARMYAASGLGRIGTKDAIEALIMTLKTPDPDVSAFVRTVLEAARTNSEDPVIRSRIDAALKDPKWKT